MVWTESPFALRRRPLVKPQKLGAGGGTQARAGPPHPSRAILVEQLDLDMLGTRRRRHDLLGLGPCRGRRQSQARVGNEGPPGIAPGQADQRAAVTDPIFRTVQDVEV